MPQAVQTCLCIFASRKLHAAQNADFIVCYTTALLSQTGDSVPAEERGALPLRVARVTDTDRRRAQAATLGSALRDTASRGPAAGSTAWGSHRRVPVVQGSEGVRCSKAGKKGTEIQGIEARPSFSPNHVTSDVLQDATGLSGGFWPFPKLWSAQRARPRRRCVEQPHEATRNSWSTCTEVFLG